MQKFKLLTLSLFLSSGFLFSQIEKIDTVMINKIKVEGLNNSKVMETMSWLTDVYGPRLTWSPEYKKQASGQNRN